MFVDLIGPGTPSDSDREEVCEILKKALTKLNAHIPGDVLQVLEPYSEPYLSS